MRPALLPVPGVLLLFPGLHGFRILAEVEGIEDILRHAADYLGTLRRYLLIDVDAHIAFADLGRDGEEVEFFSGRKLGVYDGVAFRPKAVLFRSADGDVLRRHELRRDAVAVQIHVSDIVEQGIGLHGFAAAERTGLHEVAAYPAGLVEPAEGHLFQNLDIGDELEPGFALAVHAGSGIRHIEIGAFVVAAGHAQHFEFRACSGTQAHVGGRDRKVHHLLGAVRDIRLGKGRRASEQE